MWALQPETQLFLAQLRKDREETQERLMGACNPSDSQAIQEYRVKYRAELNVYEMLVGTLETILGQVGHA